MKNQKIKDKIIKEKIEKVRIRKFRWVMYPFGIPEFQVLLEKAPCKFYRIMHKIFFGTKYKKINEK